MGEGQTVNVALGERAYDVVVTRALQGVGAAVRGVSASERVFVVTDDRVAPLWADALEAELAGAGLTATRVVVPQGEAGKHRDTWWSIVDGLITGGVDRRTPVIALGGGVVGDLTGFAAASALRGLRFIQVPTTLLAMVDSSVGGKTGFNHPRGKNLVGAFHQPRLVWAALDTLSTLEPRDWRAGLGEVVKTALIADADLFAQLERDASALRDGDFEALAPVVARCVEVKAEVVAEDERESGRRAILNAGHTVGHAYETALGYGALLHGEAVGIGLVAEAAWAVRVGLCEDPGLPERVARLLEALGLPAEQPNADTADLVSAMRVDKKAGANMLTVPIVPRVGSCALHKIPLDRLEELVQA